MQKKKNAFGRQDQPPRLTKKLGLELCVPLIVNTEWAVHSGEMNRRVENTVFLATRLAEVGPNQSAIETVQAHFHIISPPSR